MVGLVLNLWPSIPTRPLHADSGLEPKARAPELLAENPILILEVANAPTRLLAELPTTEISGNNTHHKSAASGHDSNIARASSGIQAHSQ